MSWKFKQINLRALISQISEICDINFKFLFHIKSLHAPLYSIQFPIGNFNTDKLNVPLWKLLFNTRGLVPLTTPTHQLGINRSSLYLHAQIQWPKSSHLIVNYLDPQFLCSNQYIYQLRINPNGSKNLLIVRVYALSSYICIVSIAEYFIK